jgi:hypothetical protein
MYNINSGIIVTGQFGWNSIAIAFKSNMFWKCAAFISCKFSELKTFEMWTWVQVETPKQVTTYHKKCKLCVKRLSEFVFHLIIWFLDAVFYCSRETIHIYIYKRKRLFCLHMCTRVSQLQHLSTDSWSWKWSKSKHHTNMNDIMNRHDTRIKECVQYSLQW